MKYCTYSIFRGDALLYIGSTKDLKRRKQGHLNSRQFRDIPRSELRFVATGFYATKFEALTAETLLIKSLCPPLNNPNWRGSTGNAPADAQIQVRITPERKAAYAAAARADGMTLTAWCLANMDRAAESELTPDK